jgi:CubicO group peptidase (beta-lactamase class C family)
MMRLLTRTVLGVAGLLWIVSPAAAQDLPTAAPKQVGLSPEKIAKIGETVQKSIDKKQLAGAVTIVARRGKVVWFDARGMMDIKAKKPMRKDTIFRIYSMTKAVASVAAMVLVEEGKLELDAPVSKYVPAAKEMKVGGKKQAREMTVRDLLRHTAGFPNNVTVDHIYRKAGLPPLSQSTLEEMMGRLKVVPLRYQPGKGWHYSFGTEVLARVVEVASGQPLDVCLTKKVIEPLGMKDTAFFVPKAKRGRFAVMYGRNLKPADAPQPGTAGPFKFEKAPKFLSAGGGLVSTATDYMRFCLMLSNKGVLDGKRLLKTETIEEMTRNQLPKGVGEISYRPKGRGFGLGFAIRIRKTGSPASSLGEYEWLGGGGTEFWISPRDELVAITLTQQIPMIHLGRILKPIVYGAIAEEKTGRNKPDAKRDRYLLLDSRIVETTDNAKLTVGTVIKDKNNPLMTADKPWEPRWDNMYPNVIYDEKEKIYKCWYTPFIIDRRTTATPSEQRNPKSHVYMRKRPSRRDEAVLYATSKDGVNWKKPLMDIVPFKGLPVAPENIPPYKKTNIVAHGPSGTGVILDKRDPDPSRRYKMFYAPQHGKHQRMRFSPDGINWGKEIACPGIGTNSDTHNNLVWAPELKKYVGFVRLLGTPFQRIAGRTETADFKNWTKAKPVVTLTPKAQAHEMIVFRTANCYLGLVGVMHWPQYPHFANVTQDVELFWSPDTCKWHRVQAGVPLIPRSATPGEKKEYGKMPYDWGGIFPDKPVYRDGKIWLYYGGCDWYFMDWRKGCLGRASLRADGWAGFEQVDVKKPATVTTTPLVCSGDKLRISADVSKSGSVKVTLLDKDSNQLAVGEPVKQTVTDAEVKWLGEFSLTNLKGKQIRLRFELRDSKLYSFSFE